VYGNPWECSQRPQVELLPYWLVWVAGAGGYERGEILDFSDCVFRQKKPTQRFWIQPTIGCVTQSAIVEIKAVYVDICCQSRLS